MFLHRRAQKDKGITMYLHIGNKKSIKQESIIGIFDLDTATVSSLTKKFVGKLEKEGLVEYEDSDLPRSFLLIENEKENPHRFSLRLSRISSAGLRERAQISLASLGEEK